MSAPCVPLWDWLRVFEDPQLVMVLAAHRDSAVDAEGYAALSEVACARLTYINRETVHKKKHELIERYRVLVPQPGRSGRGWQGSRCRIDHSRLSELVEKVSNCRKTSDSIAGKPAIQLPENQQLSDSIAGNPAIQLWENQQLNDSTAGKPAVAYKERAPAPGALASFQLLASCEGQAEEKQLERAIVEAVERSRLRSLGGKPLDLLTVTNLRKALEQLPSYAERRDALETIEEKCRDYLAHPSKARSWGILVSAIRGLARKRPAREAPSLQELSASINAAAAAMGGKR